MIRYVLVIVEMILLLLNHQCDTFCFDVVFLRDSFMLDILAAPKVMLGSANDVLKKGRLGAHSQDP